MNSISPKIIRQILVLLILGIIGLLIFAELLPYLSGVLGAITVYVLMHKWMDKLVKKGWKPSLAASFLMFISFIGILLPIGGMIFMLSNKIAQAINNSEKFFSAIQGHILSFEKIFGYDFYSDIDVSSATSWVTDNIQVFVGSTFNILIAVAIMYFLLYYLFTNPDGLSKTMLHFIPFNERNLKMVIKESKKMVRSNAIGIPIVAIAQGIVALIGFLIFGIENPLFWFVIVMIGSMIPFVGTLVGILPVFIITLASGHSYEAWGILIYGLAIVGSTDNIIRIYVLKKLDDVHPMITLIGVIIGVPLFGFIGLIFGPLFISLFFILLKMYQKEYGDKKII